MPPTMSSRSKILLAGPADSGKTRRILDEFIEALRTSPDPLAEDIFLVVPSIEHTDRIISLIVQKDVKGFFHRRVTTLPRLLTEVFGLGEERLASSVTRYLMLRELFQKHSWPVFESVSQSPGFLQLMLQFIAELKESRIDPAAFRTGMNRLKGLEPDLSAKYEALAAIYESYQTMLAERGLLDRPDLFEIYQERKQAGLFRTRRFRKIWLDGFFDFTPLQLAYLRELGEMTDQLTVTLTWDGAPERETLFDSVRETARLLETLGFETERMKRSAAPAHVLEQLERQVFSSRKPERLMPPSPAVTFFEAIGLEGEIEMAARRIRHLYQEGDYRFSDFAVLLRQIGPYGGAIRSIFSRYGIPVEIHERERLGFSPLIQVLVKMLRIFRDGWRRADVIDFLKSSYVRQLGDVPKSYEQIAALENAALMQGIFRGRDAWLAPWFEKRKVNEALEAIKTACLKPLADLEDALKAGTEVTALRRHLTAAVEKTFGMAEIPDSEEESVRRDAASLRRFYAILDEIERGAFLNQGQMSLEDFADRFIRITEIDLYSLRDRNKNKVQVYDISLARQKEYKVVFLSGLLERQFPVQIREDAVLSDWERRLFNGGGEVQLRERLPRQSLERFLFYLGMTRAHEQLYLTWPRVDLEGHESLPSAYIDEVRSLFRSPETMTVQQDLSRPFPDIDEAAGRRELEMGLMGELWKPEAAQRQEKPLLLWLSGELTRAEESRQKFQRAFYEIEDRLTDPALAGLFGAQSTSATRLEEYAKCAFRYYARFVLKLQDPEENVNVMIRGSVLHKVLEVCFARWAAQGHYPDLREAWREALQELEKVLLEMPLLIEKQYQYELTKEDMKETLRLFLEYELERLRQSPFKPRYFEYDFGGREPDGPALVLEQEGHQVSIRGKIDRIDFNPETGAARVIDYKRTATFDRKNLDLGVALQLPIYARVAEKLIGLRPAAAELYSLKDRKLDGFYQEAFREHFPEMGRRRPWMLEGAAFQEVLARSERFIHRFAKAMTGMQIAVRPRECSKYGPCAYSPVCRIEKWKRPMILEEIREEDRRLEEQTEGKTVS